MKLTTGHNSQSFNFLIFFTEMNRYPLPPDSETSRRVKRPRYAISILAILQIVTATLMILMMLDPEVNIFVN